MNVYHFRKNDASPQSESQALDDLQAMMDTLYLTIDNYLHEDVNFMDINGFNVTQDIPLGTTGWLTLLYGTAIGDMLPMQVAAFVRGKTGMSRNWGKKFLGPFGEASSDSNGGVSAALMGVLADYGAEWLSTTASTIGTWIPVVYHAASSSWKAINEIDLTSIWATIRRRRPGVGS